MTTAKDVLKMIKDNDVKYVDFRFTDPRGKWQHVTFDVTMIEEDTFAEGQMFDGSSIAGWKAINESDMNLMPDPATASIDPFFAETTLVAGLRRARADHRRALQPRSARHRQEGRRHGQVDGRRRHHLLRPGSRVLRVRRREVQADPYNTGFKLDSVEFPTNSDTEYEGGNLGHRIGTKKGYFPVPPQDSAQDMRSEMLGAMARMGAKVEKHHHEVASAQHELGLKFAPLTFMADQMQIYKYCIHQVANIYGKTATFMPKPIYGDNGSGMHCHQSIWKDGKPVFAGNKYADLSETCLSYIAGIIKHAKAINAFTNPTTNSYKRLVPGFEAPVLLAYSARNRSASCRIPYTTNPKAKRVEVRFPDPLANPYLGFAAMLMAGLDGIKNKLDPGDGDGQGPLRPAAGGAEEDPDGVRLAARGAREPRQGPRLPQGRRRVRRRLHRQLHRAEDDRSDPLRAHAASGRVRDVLLGVSRWYTSLEAKGRSSERPFFVCAPCPPAASRISTCAAARPARRPCRWRRRATSARAARR